jgi:hypothetical protein
MQSNPIRLFLAAVAAVLVVALRSGRIVGNSSLIRFRESAPSHVQAVDRSPILRQPNFQLPVYLFLVGEAAEGLRKTLAKS